MILPFAVPILVTLILLLVVGNAWPRDIAPGSGLKLPGLAASAATATAMAVWRLAVHAIADQRVRRFAALVCAATGLMGWPVWTVGVLPTLNGAATSNERVVVMTLQRVEVTRKSRSRDYYHWAWLKAEDRGQAALSGRYFISGTTYDRWRREGPARVEVGLGRGLLGAEVVTRLN